MAKALPDLVGLLDGLAKAGRKENEMSLREVRDTVGRRSFAPLLLTTSLIGFTPLGGVPGVPTTLAVLIVLIAAQIVVGRQALWLPRFLLDRKVKGRKVASAAKSLQPFARLVDRAIRP